MKNGNRQLVLEQVSQKLKGFEKLAAIQQPTGWIHAIRTALRMSLAQLGKRTGKSAQGVRALEQREMSGAITLQSLREIAEALDMQLVYAIVPKSGTLEDIVDLAAELKAESIVTRTSRTMELEDQPVRRKRLVKAFLQKKEELKREMPKLLWE